MTKTRTGIFGADLAKTSTALSAKTYPSNMHPHLCRRQVVALAKPLQAKPSSRRGVNPPNFALSNYLSFGHLVLIVAIDRQNGLTGRLQLTDVFGVRRFSEQFTVSESTERI